MNSPMNSIEFYESYHSHPINKLIHFFCIPMIVFSTNELLKEFYISHEYLLMYKKQPYFHIFQRKFYITWMMHQMYCIYYFVKYGMNPGLLMTAYFTVIRYLSLTLDMRKSTAFKLFLFSWVMQFIGHYIEGNRPALLDGLTQTFLEAPLYSFKYIWPNLLKNV